MLKDYILGTEIAKKGNFHQANISMLLSDFGLIEGDDYLKYGGIVLINRKSLLLPNYIKEVIKNNEFTDLSNYLPKVYFMDILENQTSNIKDKFNEVTISSKKFVQIDEGLQELFKNDNLIKTTVDNSELSELVAGGYIKGSIKLSNKKSLVWY